MRLPQVRGAYASLMANAEAPTFSPGDLSEAYGRMGHLLLAVDDVDAAEASYLNAQTLAPTDARWAFSLYQMGDPRAAYDEFVRALGSNPASARSLYGMGVMLASVGQYQQAIDRLSAAVKYDPGYVEARLQLADALRHA